MNFLATTFSAAALWLAFATCASAEDEPPSAPAPTSAPAASAVPAAPEPAPAPAATATAAPEPEAADDIVCRYEKPIGSHLRVKVCRTRAQLRAAEEDKRRAMDEARSRGHQQNASGG